MTTGAFSPMAGAATPVPAPFAGVCRDGRRASIGGGAVAGAFGVLGLFAWVADRPFLGSLGNHFVTMRPSTGFVLALLGAALLVDARRRSARATVAASILAAVVGSAYLFLFLAGHAWTPPVHPEHAALRALPLAGASPLTGIGLLLAAASLLLTSVPPSRRALRSAGGLLGLALATLSVIVAVGYAFGAPLLYGGAIRPMSLPTSLALAALAVAALARAGTERLPLRLFGGPSVEARLLRAVVPIPLAALLAKWLIFLFDPAPNPGLREAVMALLVMIVVGVASARVARSVGGTVDRLNDERERAAEALRQAERRFQLVVDQSLVGIGIYTARGCVYANRKLAEMFGYGPDEILRMDFPDVAAPGDRALAESNLRRCREGHAETVEYALQGVRKDGSPIELEIHASRMAWAGESATMAIARDVTARVRAEERLRTASVYTRSLIEASLDPLVTIGLDGSITDVNRATEEATGFPRERLVGSDFGDYFTDPGKARAGYQQVLRDGLVRDYPLTLRHVSGRTIDVLYHASVYRNEAGELQGVFAAARDVTEQRRAEERLRTAILYTRSLIEASLDPLVTISSEGSITDVNRATEEATGVPRSRLIGSDFADYFTEPDKARAGYQQVVREGLVRDYPLTLRHVSGRTTDVLYNATVYRNEAGELQGVFAAARDITGQKRAQESLARTLEDLRRSNAELEQFAYVASHDLQEPLRMVSSYTQLLAHRYEGRLGRDADDFIGFAVDGASRMQRLINDLLAYSRVGTRGKPPAVTDSASAFRQALVNLAPAMDDTGATVTAGDLPHVLADETQLVQVFQNLVGNAVKFHRPGVPPRVHVSACRDGAMWSFAVRDNGIGIAKAFQSRLFTIFQRLHTRDEYPGTGIGLAICKRIVERHGGTVRIESDSGQGATFLFTLPATDGADA